MAEEKKTPEISVENVGGLSSTVIDEITTKLQEFGIGDVIIVKIKEDLGVESVGDLTLVIESDLIKAGVKPIQARKLLASIAPITTPATTVTEVSNFTATSFEGILPSVPDDGSWIEAIKTGGMLKVDQSSVISAVRAALAYKVGLFDVPAKIVTAMEDFAEKNEEPVDPLYFSIKKQLTRHNYAEIFAAIDGLDGNYVTDKAKRKFFDRMDSAFFPAILVFYGQLKAWQEAYMQGAANPALLMAAFNGRGAAISQSMMQIPDTGALRDQGDAVADAINKAFAGIGVPITAALAYDAVQIKKTLSDPRLPAFVGAANRDQMLRQLGVAVSSTYPRLETNLTKFVLATIQAKDQSAGDEELQYFGSLSMLGSQIPWDQLGASSGITGIGGRRL